MRSSWMLGLSLALAGVAVSPLGCSAADEPSIAALRLAESAAGAAGADTAPETSWIQGPTMQTARIAHSATRLRDGSVLVVGGLSTQQSTASVELYDPASNGFTTLEALPGPRFSHTATLLTDGRVLVVGGMPLFETLGALLFDPETRTWSPAGTLEVARYEHTATLLPDGRVLIAGGATFEDALTNSVEIYDPQNAEDPWSTASPMQTARSGAVSSLLPDGRVLIASGFGWADEEPLSAEVFTPATGSWAATQPMTYPRRHYAAAVVLADGRVLVVGVQGAGQAANPTPGAVGAELFDPSNDAWSTTGPMFVARVKPGVVALSDGRVLVAGGQGPSTFLPQNPPPDFPSLVEIYDPASGTFSPAGALVEGTQLPEAVGIGGDRALVLGGLVPSDLYDRTAKTQLGTLRSDAEGGAGGASGSSGAGGADAATAGSSVGGAAGEPGYGEAGSGGAQAPGEGGTSGDGPTGTSGEAGSPPGAAGSHEGGAPSGGSGGDGGHAGSSAGRGESGGSGEAGRAHGGGAGEGGGDSGDGAVGDDGCSCRVAGEPRGGSLAFLVGSILAAGAALRRNESRRRARRTQ